MDGQVLAQTSVRPVREHEERAGGAWGRSAGRAASVRPGDRAPAGTTLKTGVSTTSQAAAVAATRASSTSDRTMGSDAAHGEAPHATRRAARVTASCAAARLTEPMLRPRTVARSRCGRGGPAPASGCRS